LIIDDVIKYLKLGGSVEIFGCSSDLKEEIISAIKVEKTLKPKIVSLSQSWREKDIKSNSLLIIKDTYQMLDNYNNGIFFEKARNKGSIFLFSTNGKIQNFKVREEWRDFLQNLGSLFRFAAKDFDTIPGPIAGWLAIKGLFRKLCKAISLFISLLVFIILIAALIFSAYKMKTTDSNSWWIISLFLSVLDLSIGINFLKISRKIYFIIHNALIKI